MPNDCAVSTTRPTRDRDLEAFLALLAARCSPRPVDAYRPDHGRLSGFRGQRLAGATHAPARLASLATAQTALAR